MVAYKRHVQVQVSQHCSMKGERLISPYALLKSYGQVTASRRGGFSFQAAGRLTTLLQLAPHTGIQAVQIGLSNFFFKSIRS